MEDPRECRSGNSVVAEGRRYEPVLLVRQRESIGSSWAWWLPLGLAAFMLLALLLFVSALRGETDGNRQAGGGGGRPSPAVPASPNAPSRSSLLSVQLISRHGSRSPNLIVAALCPAHRAQFDVYAQMHIAPAGLTGIGMRELRALGRFARRRYISSRRPLLSPYFDERQVYFRAVGERRTLQSATAMAQAMYTQSNGKQAEQEQEKKKNKKKKKETQQEQGPSPQQSQPWQHRPFYGLPDKAVSLFLVLIVGFLLVPPLTVTLALCLHSAIERWREGRTPDAS